MKLKPLAWSGKGPDPNKLRERRSLRAVADAASSPNRYVIAKKDDPDCGYSVLDGVFTRERAYITLFAQRSDAQALLDALDTSSAKVTRCKTKIVKSPLSLWGIRIPSSMGMITKQP
jgi:hypothetical protein